MLKKYRAFSLEEHRLSDYTQGKAGTRADVDRHFPVTMPTEFQHKSPRTDRQKLDLLRGSAVEIHVGSAGSLTNKSTETSVYNKWSLPKKLISHYSPFLKAACSWDFRESRDKRIELPEDDPTVFGLFVEWMYYGSYDHPLLTKYCSTDAKCWVLGDKLLCGEFKNYAFSRLYERHTDEPFHRAVSYDDVQYVWDNTASVSKLRQFYINFVVQHFANRDRLLGTAEDWDSLLQNHPDMRILLLGDLRKDPSLRMRVGWAKDYFEEDMSHPNPIPKLMSTSDVQLSIREKKTESWNLMVSGEVTQEPSPDLGLEPARDDINTNS